MQKEMSELTETISLEKKLDHFLLENPQADPSLAKKFLESRIPDKSVEEFKYSDLRGILQRLPLESQPGYLPVSSVAASDYPGHEDAYVLKLVNGIPVETPSVDGINFTSKEISVPDIADPMPLLNRAYSMREINIHVEAEKKIGQPLMIIHEIDPSESSFIQSRISLELLSGADLKVANFQHKKPGRNAFHNQLLSVNLHASSELEFVRIQEENPGLSQFCHAEASLENASKLKIFTATLGGGFVRNNYRVKLSGRHSAVELKGVNVLNLQSHADTWIEIQHLAPDCQSDQLFRNVIGGEATAAFTGKIFVDRPAQKTNAYQSNKNIVISDKANAYSRPQLEIYADDVKCSHGSTTGKMDEDAFFYLRARGISKEKARALLLEAFLADVITSLHDPAMEQVIRSFVMQQLEKIILSER